MSADAASPDADPVAVILVEPEQPENVGAVARVLANLGWSDLRFVGPAQPDWSSLEPARRLAHGALEVLDAARTFPTLAAAIADRGYLVATSARQRETRRSHRLDDDFAPRLAAEHAVGLVFGNERAGLANADVELCHEVLEIPTWGGQWSLNLSQAVLLVGYTLRRHQAAAPPRPKRPRPVARQIEHTLAHLEGALEQIGFWKPGLEDRSRDHLRRILLAGVESTQELGVVERLADRIRRVAGGDELRPA